MKHGKLIGNMGFENIINGNRILRKILLNMDLNIKRVFLTLNLIKWKLLLVLIITIIIFSLSNLVSALTPPINIDGVVKINNEFVPDGTNIDFYGDCYGNGTNLIQSIKTISGKGYYSIFIPMDDLSTQIDEGCTSSQIISMNVLESSINISLPSPGSTPTLFIEFESENNGSEDSQPVIKKITGTGGGGGGGSSSGSKSNTVEYNPTGIIKPQSNQFSQFVINNPPLQPVNIYGLVNVMEEKISLEGNVSLEGLMLDIICNDQIVLRTNIINKGYYNVNLNIFDSTMENAICKIGDLVDFQLEGYKINLENRLQIKNSGAIIQHDLIFSERSKNIDSPNIIETNPIGFLDEKKEIIVNIYNKNKTFIFILLVLALITTLLTIFEIRQKPLKINKNL